MKNQKGFAWLPVLLIIVAVVVVGGGAYYFSIQNSPSQTSIYQEATTTPTTQTTSKPTSAATNQPAQKSKVDPQLSASPTSGAAPLNVSFSANKQGLIDYGSDLTVEFGDGTKSSTADFTCGLQYCTQQHSYNAPGTYNVKYSDSTGKNVSAFKITVSVPSASTYSNSQYGFSVQYPSNLNVDERPTGSRGLRIVQISTLLPSNAFGSVQISTNPIDSSCFQTSATNDITVGTTTINGLQFHTVTRASVSGGSFDRSYAAAHGDYCYNIQEDISGMNNQTISQSDYDALKAELDPIALTFRFTN